MNRKEGRLIVKALLLIFGICVSIFVYSVAYAVTVCAIHGTKAIGWPALRNDPIYWLLMFLIVGIKVWLGMHRVF